jgi:hypothetical protein
MWWVGNTYPSRVQKPAVHHRRDSRAFRLRVFFEKGQSSLDLYE